MTDAQLVGWLIMVSCACLILYLVAQALCDWIGRPRGPRS